MGGLHPLRFLAYSLRIIIRNFRNFRNFRDFRDFRANSANFTKFTKFLVILVYRYTGIRRYVRYAVGTCGARGQHEAGL